MQAVFDILSRSSVPLLIVGGHALTAHGVLRQTFDVDCLIADEDAETLDSLLRAENYELAARSNNFARYRSRLPNLPEVDVLFVDRDTFDKLQHNSIPLQRRKHRFQAPGLMQLIALKLHAIRNEPRRSARDVADITELLRLNPGKVSSTDLEELCQRFGPPGIRDKLPKE